MADPWAVLGVPRHAPAEDCKRAFHALALRLHPDVNPSPTAARDFQRLRDAYDAACAPLSDFAARGDAQQQQRYRRPDAAYAASLRARAEAFRARQAAAAAEAEAMGRRRGGAGAAPRSALLSALDSLLHPRVLLIALPLLAAASWFMLRDLSGKGGAADRGEELVMAVFNKERRRWEVPAHKHYFTERLVLVRRHLVHDDDAPAVAGCGEEPAPLR